MLRRANRAQAGIQRLHDQALVGAESSRVGIRLGLRVLSKPDDNMGMRSGDGYSEQNKQDKNKREGHWLGKVGSPTNRSAIVVYAVEKEGES
jgi:hypothetical protein